MKNVICTLDFTNLCVMPAEDLCILNILSRIYFRSIINKFKSLDLILYVSEKLSEVLQIIIIFYLETKFKDKFNIKHIRTHR